MFLIIPEIIPPKQTEGVVELHVFLSQHFYINVWAHIYKGHYVDSENNLIWKAPEEVIHSSAACSEQG